MTVVRPYRGVSADDRRAERRERLVEAVLNVIGVEGVAGTTVDKVCIDAGLTKRYFYEGFSDLDALMLEALDLLFVRVFGRMTEAAAAHNTRSDQVHAIVTAVIGDLAADPRGARLYVESPGHRALRDRREDAIVAFTDFVAGQVMAAEADDDTVGLRVRVIVAGATDVITGFLAGTSAP
jgi:AcrR family transcriptional regulator